MPDSASWTRVIVLLPANSAPSAAAPAPPPRSALDERLSAQFAARDWFALEHHDPYLAFAELCLRDRAQVSRAAWGLERIEQIALAIIEPDRRLGGGGPELSQLIQATQHYVPNASIWSATDGELSPLSPANPRSIGRIAMTTDADRDLAPADDGSALQTQIANLQPRLQTPKLEDRSEAKTSSPAPSTVSVGDSIDQQRISREEIDMLLANDVNEGAA